MTIGENLKTLRQRSGMTQQQAADSLGVTRQTVSGYESDRSRPDIDMLKDIAALYGTDLESIVYGTEPALKAKKAIKNGAVVLLVLLTVITAVGDAFLCVSRRWFFPDALETQSVELLEKAVKLSSVWEKMDGIALATAIVGGLILLVAILVTRTHFPIKQKLLYIVLLAAGLLLPPVVFGSLDPMPGVTDYMVAPTWTLAHLVLFFFVLLIAEAIKKRADARSALK